MITAKPDPRLGYLTLLAIVSTAFVGLYPLIAPVLAQTSIKSIGAGKLLRVTTATQGYTGFGGTAYFSTYTRTASGLNLFTEFGIGGIGMYTLGFASDTAATTMTITSATQYDLVYTTSGAGTQRVYCPFLKEPTTVTGATYTWNPSTQIGTFTTTGAETVTLHWSTTLTASGGVQTAAQVASQLLPIIAIVIIFAAYKSPEDRWALMQWFIVVALMAFMANLLASWGL